MYNIIFVIINTYYMLRWFLQREALAEALEWTDEEVPMHHALVHECDDCNCLL